MTRTALATKNYGKSPVHVLSSLRYKNQPIFRQWSDDKTEFHIFTQGEKLDQQTLCVVKVGHLKVSSRLQRVAEEFELISHIAGVTHVK